MLTNVRRRRCHLNHPRIHSIHDRYHFSCLSPYLSLCSLDLKAEVRILFLSRTPQSIHGKTFNARCSTSKLVHSIPFHNATRHDRHDDTRGKKGQPRSTRKRENTRTSTNTDMDTNMDTDTKRKHLVRTRTTSNNQRVKKKGVGVGLGVVHRTRFDASDYSTHEYRFVK